MFQKLSEGTPQQQAQMRAFRAHAKKLYTVKKPTCYSFAVEIELLESQIRAHWGRADAKAFMGFLINNAWDYISPYEYVKEWTLKAVEHIKEGMTFEELQATGLLEQEGSLIPLWNSENLVRRHELLAYDEEQQKKHKPTFTSQIAYAIKRAKGFTPSNN